MKILDKLYDESVVSFKLKDKKRQMTVLEECDLCFSVDLSKVEVKQLIDELTELYEEMS